MWYVKVQYLFLPICKDSHFCPNVKIKRSRVVRTYLYCIFRVGIFFSTVCKCIHFRQYAKVKRPEFKKEIRQYAKIFIFANTQLPQGNVEKNEGYGTFIINSLSNLTKSFSLLGHKLHHRIFLPLSLPVVRLHLLLRHRLVVLGHAPHPRVVRPLPLVH